MSTNLTPHSSKITNPLTFANTPDLVKEKSKYKKPMIITGVALLTLALLVAGGLALHFTGNLHTAGSMIRKDATIAGRGIRREWHWLAIGGAVTLLTAATIGAGILYHRHNHKEKSPIETTFKS